MKIHYFINFLESQFCFYNYTIQFLQLNMAAFKGLILKM